MANGFFQGTSGGYSMRRLIAFLFAIAGILGGCFSIWKGYDWKIIAASFGVPSLSMLFLMFFTTWDDISKVVSFKKGE
ncbi:MAG: hypothetical protein KBT21_08665 [Treponema sp.]|nr:hypothetical protein [Candidatus Treponema merdequi]